MKLLQPSTIDGYRTAIADKVGNTKVNISKDENLNRLLDSFHRGKPKGRRGVPSWNLSLVLHQLTKAPFEPLRNASLKHLACKTVFLLALGSGKWRSEIHAWLHRNIRHQEDWSNVSLYQVRAHDVRAFVAYKAFQGVRLDQILSACHWKSHNTSSGCPADQRVTALLTSIPFVHNFCIYKKNLPADRHDRKWQMRDHFSFPTLLP